MSNPPNNPPAAKISDQARLLFERSGGNLAAVAQSLGVTPVRAAGAAEPFIVAANGVTYVEDCWSRPEKLGRPEIARFMISSRHVNEMGWPLTDKQAIETGRRNYDDGLVELMTGRDGSWMLLYSFPNKKRAPKRQFFSGETRGL